MSESLHPIGHHHGVAIVTNDRRELCPTTIVSLAELYIKEHYSTLAEYSLQELRKYHSSSEI